jgi:(2Fe-2S) ferredoxin
MDFYRAHVLICAGTGCSSMDSRIVHQNMETEIAKRGLDKEIKVIETGCFGFCNMGPIMVVYPEGTFYCQVKPSDAALIVEEHLIKGRPVQRLLYDKDKSATETVDMENIQFFKHKKTRHS